jgi:hypothetical protein
VPKDGYVQGPARFSQNEAVSLQITKTSTSPIRNKTSSHVNTNIALTNTRLAGKLFLQLKR